MDVLFKDQCHLYTYDDDDDGVGGGGDRQRDLCLSLIYGLCEHPWGREAHLTHVTAPLSFYFPSSLFLAPQGALVVVTV